MDELLELYNLCADFCERHYLPILDRANFPKFCAAIAKLSSVEELIDEPERSVATRLNATLKSAQPGEQSQHKGSPAEKLEWQAEKVLARSEPEWLQALQDPFDVTDDEED
jgi:hypothetical protein